MSAAIAEVVRVVRLRKGVPKPIEFQLRPGESGLSVFEYREHPSSMELIQAVRDAGKQGELGAMLLSVSAILQLGLCLVKTQGGTPNPAINALQWEIRVKWWQRGWLWLRRRPLHEYFNSHFAARLCELARFDSE